MKAWGVEYLIVRPGDEGYAVVRPIVDPKFEHPDLTLVKTFADGTLVWKVRLTDYERKNNQRILRGDK